MICFSGSFKQSGGGGFLRYISSRIRLPIQGIFENYVFQEFSSNGSKLILLSFIITFCLVDDFSLVYLCTVTKPTIFQVLSNFTIDFRSNDQSVVNA